MEIEIRYCTEWDYEPQAASLAEELLKQFGAEATIIPGSHGIFDVVVDGKLVYSKFETGRFPNPGEVVENIQRKDSVRRDWHERRSWMIYGGSDWKPEMLEKEWFKG